MDLFALNPELVFHKFSEVLPDQCLRMSVLNSTIYNKFSRINILKLVRIVDIFSHGVNFAF